MKKEPESDTSPLRQAKTIESQGIAIALACGAVWKSDQFGNRMLVDEVKDRILFMDVHGGFDVGLPDYRNDLNAMHEAEQILTFDQWPTYVDHLIDNAPAPKSKAAHQGYEVCHATAAQRAEAFLRTLELWKDDASRLETVDSDIVSSIPK